MGGYQKHREGCDSFTLVSFTEIKIQKNIRKCKVWIFDGDYISNTYLRWSIAPVEHLPEHNGSKLKSFKKRLFKIFKWLWAQVWLRLTLKTREHLYLLRQKQMNNNHFRSLWVTHFSFEAQIRKKNETSLKSHHQLSISGIYLIISLLVHIGS